ncbi:MAG TPA: hypothetical protein DIC56_14045 [Rhizobium sp.]|nr:hypothetical protein [Rhizobium sp.]
MINLLRKPLLVSSTALLSLAVLPAVVSGLALPLASSVVSVAYADDDNGGGGGNDDNGGGNDDNGNDDNGNDDHGNDDGPGADDDGSDDDANGMDDDAKGMDDTTDDIDDDNAANGRADETQLVVNDTQLAGLKNGQLIAVDQAGQRLRLRFEWEHGKPEVKFKDPANTVTAVTVVPAN